MYKTVTRDSNSKVVLYNCDNTLSEQPVIYSLCVFVARQHTSA